MSQSSALFAQLYNFTATGAGFEEIAYTDINNPLNPVLFNYPGSSMNLRFGNMTGTLLYNAGSDTFQLNASMPVSQTSFNTTFTESPLIKGVSTPVTVSINSQVNGVNNGVFSVNTGLLTPTHPNANNWNVLVDIPISGSYSVTTGGRTYTGNFNYDLDFTSPFQLTTPGAANSSVYWYDSIGSFQSRPELNEIIASNGVVVQLSTMDPNPAGGPNYGNWNYSGSAQVQVPETLGYIPPISLLIGTTFAHACWRRRRNHFVK